MSSTSRATGSQQVGLALVGNPGGGKSTILNGVAGEVLFKSGVAIGGGLTTVLSQHEKDGVMLFDTPGLADIERRKQAGQELDKLLGRQLPLKIAFVVTLERGRVRPEDAMTIDLVLSAIRSVHTEGRFGVIVNQMSATIREQLKQDPIAEAKMHKYLTGERSTPHWCYVDEDRRLSDAPDQMLMTGRLQRFLISLPETKPRGASVVQVDTSAVQEQLKKQTMRIMEVEKASAEREQQLVKEMLEQKHMYMAKIGEVAVLEKRIREQQDAGIKKANESNSETRKTGTVAPRMGVPRAGGPRQMGMGMAPPDQRGRGMQRSGMLMLAPALLGPSLTAMFQQMHSTTPTPMVNGSSGTAERYTTGTDTGYVENPADVGFSEYDGTAVESGETYSGEYYAYEGYDGGFANYGFADLSACYF